MRRTAILIFVLAATLMCVARQYHFRGRILNQQTRRGIENLLVTLIPPNSSPEARRYATSDSGGKFRFDGLNADKYLLQVSEGPYLLFRQEIYPQHKDEITIQLEPSKQ